MCVATGIRVHDLDGVGLQHRPYRVVLGKLDEDVELRNWAVKPVSPGAKGTNVIRAGWYEMDSIKIRKDVAPELATTLESALSTLLIATANRKASGKFAAPISVKEESTRVKTEAAD